MTKSVETQSSRAFVYSITLILGLSFSAVLLWLVWTTSLDENKQDFLLQSISLEDAITTNVRSAHNAINNIVSFITAIDGVSENEYAMYISSVLQQHPFILSVIYSSEDHLFRNYQNDISEHTGVNDIDDIVNSTDVTEGFHSADGIVSLVAKSNSKQRNYWLLQKINANNPDKKNNTVAILVDTGKLLGSIPTDSEISIMMFNDNAGLSNREMLYFSPGSSDQGFSVLSLNEEGVIPFPLYSVRVSNAKNVLWSEVSKDGVYIALIIGFGVTLLLMALVQAREQQAIELKERNIVIEHQVEEQTKELALARDQALDAVRIKSDFLASMSHEIRTPLNAILGMSELLSETPLNQEQNKYINIFRRAGDTLLALVNDILDLSKIEAQQLVLEEINFNLIDNIEETVEIYALKGAEKGIELLAHIDNDIAQIRVGDPSRLRQIILNLISNALKFTEEGEIVVRVTKDLDSSDEDYLRISVSDTGIGIPKEKLEAIFASFTQVDSSTTRKYGGTGLGLTISRSLTEMMNGKIWVESDEGKGSTFIFTAKLDVADNQDSAFKQAIDIKKKKVLMVDDNSTNRLIINKQLSTYGAFVTEAESGVEAVEIVNKLKMDNDKFDVILVDCRMPGMDGFELIELLKANGVDLGSVLMLSSADLGDNVSKARDMGIARFLVKPIKQAELLQQLQATISDAIHDEKQVHSKTEVEPEGDKPLKILLVEDNPDNRLLIKAYLKKLPYEIDEAENGQIAVDKFQTAEYNIVLMDVQMPVMDGHQSTRTIRAWERENEKTATPIISLTAHAIKEEIDKCFEAGCDTHLAKPVKKSTLIDTIKTYTSA